MSQDNLIKLQCSECKEINYYTHKNVKKIQEKLSTIKSGTNKEPGIKKHCPKCKKHTIHSEKKKK